MTIYVFPPPPQASLPVSTGAGRFPIRRVFCVGRNYAAHAREMGKDPDREPPFFFMKPADAVLDANGVIPYPSLTAEFHHKVGLTRFLPAHLHTDGAEVTPVPWHGSADVPALTRANAYLVVDSDRAQWNRGDEILHGFVRAFNGRPRMGHIFRHSIARESSFA